MVRDLVDVLRLLVEIPCLLHRGRRTDTADTPVLRRDFKILELVRLIHDELVDAKFFKGDGFVLVLSILLLQFGEFFLMTAQQRLHCPHGKVILARCFLAQPVEGFFQILDCAFTHSVLPRP